MLGSERQFLKSNVNGERFETRGEEDPSHVPPSLDGLNQLSLLVLSERQCYETAINRVNSQCSC